MRRQIIHPASPSTRGASDMLKKFLLIAVSLTLLAGCNLGKALDAGGDAYKAANLSEEEVKRDGKLVADELDSKNTVAKGNTYAKRLEKITAKLKNEDGLTLNYKVYMVKDVNAFALPDGSIRVFAGLMDMMTDDELFFVIGHEIGHVKLGHSADAFRVAYGASAGRKGAQAAGGVAGALSSSELGALGEDLINAQFSQQQELSSDDYGLALIKKYNRKTAAAESALRKLASLGESGGMLSSHPDSGKRADRMKAEANTPK